MDIYDRSYAGCRWCAAHMFWSTNYSELVWSHFCGFESAGHILPYFTRSKLILRGACMCSSHQVVLSTRRHPAQPVVSVLILHLIRGNKSHDTQILRISYRCIKSTVERNERPCHRPGRKPNTVSSY